VLRWLAQHQESGWKEEWESRYGSPEGQSWTVSLEWKSEVDGLFGKELLITTARLPGAQTAVRAEAQDTWLLPRSPAARVPDTARFMTVSVKRGGQRRARSISASNPGLIRRVAKLINAQKVVQTEFYPSCGPPPPPGTNPRLIRLAFYARPGDPLLAEASQQVPAGPCQPLLLEIPGGEDAALYGGLRVVNNIRGVIRRIFD
jgi:hypothetical protein